MKGNLFQGFSYLIQGFQIICQPGFRLFLLVPVCVNVILFTLLIVWANSLMDGWMATLLSWVPEWLGFLEWLFWIVYFFAILMTLFYGFVAAANLIGAPFYGYLAEITEKHLTGESQDETFSWKVLVSMIPRTIKRELQKLMYYLPRIIGLFILGLIPGLNLFAALIWIIFSAWMMAIQYIDYPADNHQMSFPEMLNYLRSHRLTSLGFGILTFGATLFPIMNLLAIPAAVCGAVAFWEHEKQALGDINLDFELEAQKKLRNS
jgi:CysZ protein